MFKKVYHAIIAGEITAMFQLYGKGIIKYKIILILKYHPQIILSLILSLEIFSILKGFVSSYHNFALHFATTVNCTLQPYQKEDCFVIVGIIIILILAIQDKW